MQIYFSCLILLRCCILPAPRHSPQHYEMAQQALNNLKLSPIERMVACAKILDAAGDKGILKTRALEKIKRMKSAKPEAKKLKAAQQTAKKILATGISVPNSVNGVPVDASVGVQKLQYIADTIDAARVADLAKRNVHCPFPKCSFRWTDAKYMQPHFNAKHPGFELSSFSSLLPAPSPLLPAPSPLLPAPSPPYPNYALALSLLQSSPQMPPLL